MFGKSNYTPGWEDVLRLSNSEAMRLRSKTIEPEHLLLGLIRKGDGLAIQMLLNLGVNLADLKKTIEQTLPKESAESLSQLLMPSERIKVVLGSAKEMARLKGHGWIGTEHLALALIKADEQTRAILEQHGVTLEAASAETDALIHGSPSPAAIDTIKNELSKGTSPNQETFEETKAQLLQKMLAFTLRVEPGNAAPEDIADLYRAVQELRGLAGGPGLIIHLPQVTDSIAFEPPPDKIRGVFDELRMDHLAAIAAKIKDRNGKVDIHRLPDESPDSEGC